MNTLEEFEKRLSNLLDFVDENRDELVNKYKLGLYLNYSYIKDNDTHNTGVAIGNLLNIICAFRGFFRRHPEFREILEKII